MSHKHHIIPKHAGGSDRPENLVELSVEEHAEAHRLLYEQYGRWQDKTAWEGLTGLISKEELVRILQSEGGKASSARASNWFKNPTWQAAGNAMRNLEFAAAQQKKANSPEAIAKKKETWKRTKRGEAENNSQFGKVWCIEESAISLVDRKKFNIDDIPAGWISTSDWKDRRKNKSNNAYGRHWYNDSKKNYYLLPDDVKIVELQLEQRRLINNKNSVNPS